MWPETLLAILLASVLFDVNYFIRVLFLKLAALVRQPCKESDATVVYGFSLSGIDIAGQHLNNARYFKDIEFARLNFLLHAGLYGNGSVQGATTIRYRRAISVLSVYKVVTKMVYRDSTAFYLEHNFITPHDNFIRATALCKETLPGGDGTKLAMSRDLELWLRSIETSNEKLRPYSA